MEFKFHHILAFLSLAIVATSHAASPPEDYWKSVLPNSPMPKSVKDLLHSSQEWLEDKSTAVGVGKGGVNVNTGPGKPGGTAVNVGHGNVGVNTGKPGHRTNVGVRKGGVTVGTRTKNGRPVYVGVHPGPNPFNYLYAATETQLHENPNVALFFLEKDLHAGKKMNLHFSKTTDDQATLFPRQIADSIPFSSNKFPEILNKFSVNPNSDEAEVMKKTIKECEEKGVKGEEKFCATSLESMIDFTTSKIGKNVEAFSTNAENAELKEYDILGVKKMPSEKAAVVCHRQEYAYAVFYCHKTENTAAYEVAMVAGDGSKAEGVAVCHRDTAEWNPKHLAFQVLKVKPGSVPVCHFLPQDHIVWVPKALLEDKNTRVGAKTPITGSAYIYNYAAVETHLHESPIVALFFLEKDLHEGKKMNLHFSKATNDVTLLPRQVADSIPFSSNKLPEILNKFSVNPNSAEAEIMKKTIKECKDKSIKGEEKYCATSLESLIDFTTSKLGKNVEAISTDAENGTFKMYNIVGVKKMPSEKAVLSCHKQPCAYVVFYCHKTETTIAYEVALMAGDGSKAEAVAVCHRDTQHGTLSIWLFKC
ncbi:hypothetical protein BUALT_Bualt10G0111800 [Buddleja alternifolia]|uniref:BURP domain-containing protein n=1 Tax=Buddleja alternifolia TaxID=168488 RepID=A0AAV6WX22_9LAMI|nr:hypothetical protein BUALT_Bualt10G0111800 [Buddleja alternifolia]